jgi:predicted RecB family nuclease
MIHVITDSLLQDHLKCNFKSYLRLRAPSGHATDYLALCSRLDARHVASGSQWLAAQSMTGRVSLFGGSHLQNMVSGDEIILDAVGVADGLETHFHALQRMEDPSQGPYQYRPIRFCRHLQPNSAVHLLLAFDALILGHLQGVSPDDGILFCGPTFRRVRVRLRAHLKSLAIVLTRLRVQSASDREPPLVLNRHCEICEFKQPCRAKAVETDNLTLLKGMTLKEMARHNSKGIFSVKQLSYTFRPRRPAKRQKQRFHHNFALQALALREKKVHVHGDPILVLPETQVYLDIEGLPDRGTYYLIGVLIVTGQSERYHCFWANDEGSQVTIFAQLAALLAENTDWRLFHFGNYEVIALRRMLSRVPNPHRESLETILANSTNILSIISSHVYFPTNSNSLKEVAAFLGFHWSSVGASGLDSVVWREQWEDGRDDVLKAKLLQYNRDDCLALHAVTDFIASITTHQGERQSKQSPFAEVVYTGELQPAMNRKHRFGKAEFCLPDFEFVNRCAYFDYQRDRVNVRGAKRPALADLHPRPKRMHRPKANKYFEVRSKRCSHCNSRRLLEGRALSTRTIDMKFFAGGVKKWVSAYSSWQYRCYKCGKSFKPPEYPQTTKRYGDGLANWIVYQNVALGQNLLKLEQSLREVFRLDVPRATVQRFKGLVARRYKPTNEAILAELLRGPSLNVDETEARLAKEKAHVWVFAGTRGAYYECRDSRNGRFLAERLKGFGGVLVSDFFTAYDAIECPQQKCLIHLIRDMNEDVKANPYDEELKRTVQAFAIIMRPIIETADRYGLTKSRLQRHKSAAMGFVEKVGTRLVSSDAATKYQKRINKYGNRLFTFLDYDCVPWHNNNAEHAIKAFARYRRFADGRFTTKSVTEYLAILSVFQTCEYRRINVLDFLLSGEANLDRGIVRRS